MRPLILANFGGPRSLLEIRPFLTELLTDQDVIQTSLPQRLHRLIFRRVARKRTGKVAGDYESIGGGSPIHGDTEWVARELERRLDREVIPFHRYLPATHSWFTAQVNRHPSESFDVFPMFPQFTYATTGSVARWFAERLHRELHWIRSYPDHPAFIAAHAELIRERLEPGTFLLFSAHGVPVKYVEEGDPYREECERSYRALASLFPDTPSLLAYQSQFGKGEWLKPATAAVAEKIESYAGQARRVLVVPLSFTSDHIETLFEIEEEVLPPIRAAGLEAERVPALNRSERWLSAICTILQESPSESSDRLIRSAK